VLKVAEADGTWVDFETIGKPCGAALALHGFYPARQAPGAESRRARRALGK
jgi:hypothetical protein